MRKLKVFNLSDRKREVKIFFYQRFILHQSFAGDTGYFDPINNTVIHYKGQRVFCVNSVSGDKGFDSYSIGNFGIEGKEGTFRDAEDGILSKNPIEHGRVDSVIGNTIEISGQGDGDIFYWLAVGKSIQEVIGLNAEILEKTPLHILKTTQDFWNAWVNNQEFNFHGLDPEVIELFKKSLLILHTHVDNDGSIIASGDSDMLQGGRDTYAYMWPRDGAYAALAMDRAGDYNIAERFFQFCDEVISPAGYFMHKYRPDKSLGSSWHPWVKNGKVELPIQEDETAHVLVLLWKYYEVSKNLEFIENIYNSLIKKAAVF
jgi:GH15 family glucan-1,4-alpha-glucosidase